MTEEKKIKGLDVKTVHILEVEPSEKQIKEIIQGKGMSFWLVRYDTTLEVTPNSKALTYKNK